MRLFIIFDKIKRVQRELVGWFLFSKKKNKTISIMSPSSSRLLLSYFRKFADCFEKKKPKFWKKKQNDFFLEMLKHEESINSFQNCYVAWFCMIIMAISLTACTNALNWMKISPQWAQLIGLMSQHNCIASPMNVSFFLSFIIMIIKVPVTSEWCVV